MLVVEGDRLHLIVIWCDLAKVDNGILQTAHVRSLYLYLSSMIQCIACAKVRAQSRLSRFIRPPARAKAFLPAIKDSAMTRRPTAINAYWETQRSKRVNNSIYSVIDVYILASDLTVRLLCHDIKNKVHSFPIVYCYCSRFGGSYDTFNKLITEYI